MYKRQAAVFRKESGGEKSINREFCRTAHKRRQHYCHFAVTFGRKGTAGHNGRDSASEAYKHGNNTSAGQTDFAQKLIHDKCNSCHISGIFKKGKKKKKYYYYRYKTKYASYPRKNTVYYQGVKYFIDICGGEQSLSLIHIWLSPWLIIVRTWLSASE